MNKWAGVVLIPTVNDFSGDPEYKRARQIESKEKLLNTLYWGGFMVLLAFVIVNVVAKKSDYLELWISFLLTKFSGLFIVTLIQKVELGRSNSIVNRICSTSNCNKVLKSKGSKIFSWLSLGDICLVYFAGGVFVVSKSWPANSLKLKDTFINSKESFAFQNHFSFSIEFVA